MKNKKIVKQVNNPNIYTFTIWLKTAMKLIRQDERANINREVDKIISLLNNNIGKVEAKEKFTAEELNTFILGEKSGFDICVKLLEKLKEKLK